MKPRGVWSTRLISCLKMKSMRFSYKMMKEPRTSRWKLKINSFKFNQTPWRLQKKKKKKKKNQTQFN